MCILLQIILKTARKTFLFKRKLCFFTMVSFNYNCLNKPEHLGSHPFSTRIFSAPGPDPLVLTGTNQQNKPPLRSSECTMHFSDTGNILSLAWCPVPTHQRKDCAWLWQHTRTHHSSRPRNSICTAQQELVTRAAYVIEKYLQKKAVVLRQIEC